MSTPRKYTFLWVEIFDSILFVRPLAFSVCQYFVCDVGINSIATMYTSKNGQWFTKIKV